MEELQVDPLAMVIKGGLQVSESLMMEMEMEMEMVINGD
mgnify:FL=1